ncbi:Pectinesterase inhibitor 11 [Vitis vinifera]|uniref:Pectinesterase inhibitor 11 n=1 Tax=Vitis vinifera TaxID=29760 RepID=A0A438EL82_VITVI|nr:Pectinesterase inhibitor 11 [Vitis vinifera]
MKTHTLLFNVALLSAALLFAAAAATTPTTYPDNSKAVDFIRTSCNATLYPKLCYTSLSAYANTIQQSPAHLARVAVAISLSRARHMASYVANLSRQADYGSAPRTAAALHDCFSTFGDAIDQIRGSLKQMRQLKAGESFRFQMGNVQTWMSAALTNEDTCTDGFEDAPDGAVKSEVCDRVENVKKFTSNALALVNSYVNKETNAMETP